MKNEYDMLNDAVIDLSAYEEAVLSERERINMKKAINKRVNWRRTGILAACICLLGILSQTALAQEIWDRIIKTVSTGYNNYYQYDMTDAEAPLPDVFKGLIYNEAGEPVETWKQGGVYYDKDGNAITDWEEFAKKYADEEIKIQLAEKEEDPLVNAEKRGWLILKEEEEINSYLCFNASLPEYMPEGFEFYGATVFEDSKYYMMAYYINKETGEYFSLNERFLNDETAFETGTDGKLEEIEINGSKAVVINGRNVYWERDGVSVGVSGHGVLSEEELLKVAESIR